MAQCREFDTDKTVTESGPIHASPNREDASPKQATDQRPSNQRATQAKPIPAAPKKRALSNNAINFIVDGTLLVSFTIVLSICGIVQFIFPAASESAGWTLFDLTYDGWIRTLTISIAAFSVLVLLHLILHWSWVCSFVTSRLSKLLDRRVTIDESSKTIWGVGVLIVVLTAMGVVVGIAEFCIVEGGALPK